MPLKDFKNERQFSEELVRPLLGKLGYIMVTNTCGPSEGGKDIVFAEFDRFENLRYLAAQVKFGPVSVGKDVDDLMAQIRQMFEMPIREPTSGREKRISAAYIVASGTISVQASDQIVGKCRAEKFGENLYFLDGERLEHLDAFAGYQDYLLTVRHLKSALCECEANMEILKNQRGLFHAGPRTDIPLERCFTLCASKLVTDHLPMEGISYKDLHEVISRLNYLNRVCDSWNSVPLPTPEDALRKLEDAVKAVDDFKVLIECALGRLTEKHRVSASWKFPSGT